MSRDKKYYLAYDSDMNIAKMKRCCPAAQLIGTAVIENHELLFRGSDRRALPTIAPLKGSHIPAVVWKVDSECEAVLDAFHLCYNSYYKKKIKIPVKALNGKGTATKNCIVYIMSKEQPLGIPAGYHKMLCLEACRDFGFDIRTILEAASKSSGRMV